MESRSHYASGRYTRRGIISGLAATLALSAVSGCDWLSQDDDLQGDLPDPVVTPTSLPGSLPTHTPSPVNTPIFRRADGYLAVAPRVLRIGQTENVSVSLFRGSDSGAGDVEVSLFQDRRQVLLTKESIQGRGEITLAVPQLDEGEYRIRIAAANQHSESPVRVEEGVLVFVETDKPIYKPGQTIHIRVITLNSSLRPLTRSVTVELADAKGTKIYRRETDTDEYGMATLDVPVSIEPNLGVWKVIASSGKRSSQIDVRVERYVLPKYEVKVDLPREWVIADEPILGSVEAEYSYGKPVHGEVEIRATRYVGVWEEFATITKQIEGRTDFRLPAVGYVSGVPGSGGMGNVTLEVIVREPATGYEEKATTLLTVVASPTTLRLIPESVTFKPSLPLTLLIVAETPDKKPVDARVQVEFTYTMSNFNVSQESRQVSIRQGKALLQTTPPADAISLGVAASGDGAYTSVAMRADYSPTGSFIHLEQVSPGPLRVGDIARFRIAATKQAANFYYEVVSRGMVVFSDYSRSPDIELTLTPLMAPTARLLAYQILPTTEVAADYIPFNVEGSYPHKVDVGFEKEEVKPGESVAVEVRTEGPARVGLAAVDRSVFILAENRLNLAQVFAELERLYMKPQIELHEAWPLDRVTVRGAREVFADAGVVVLSNKRVPEGKEYTAPRRRGFLDRAFGAIPEALVAPAMAPVAEDARKSAMQESPEGAGLAEVQRVRQFFPETWIWTDIDTDSVGRATRSFEAPDSITTWMLRAVALSRENGLGISEASLRVFQPFFVQVDLPYSAIRGEEFPVRVALYNYLDSSESFQVAIDRDDWFELLDQPLKTVTVGPNDVGGVSFKVRPRALGSRKFKITARSRGAADAIIKDLIIEPEGVQREIVENLVLSAGGSRVLDLSVPIGVIEGSARAYLALTGNYLTQTIEGLEGLLQMPFGCGEQNMILFAPNVFVMRYLKETNQMKPEVMAKAENLMITGYQRQLTYRRDDDSFSAFGDQDQIGSLWLTAFVLKSFAQARDVVYIDESVLSTAQTWITRHQQADGSFEPVGFVHHQEMLGGLSGKPALTAFVAIALREYGETTVSGRAVRYLEGALDSVTDAYALAIVTYALELARSPRADGAYERLMGMANESDEGLYWGYGPDMPDPLEPILPQPRQPGGPAPAPPIRDGQSGLLGPSAAIETTAYATLALVARGDRVNAARAARWLVSRRNSYGGFGSTQDTVVGLQALTAYAAGARSDVNATVIVRSDRVRKDVQITPSNSDVLQVIDVPVNTDLGVEVRGKGQVVLQTVRRFNVPDPAKPELSVFEIDVDYGVDKIEVDDLITVRASVRYNPPEPLEAGMVVLDVSVPTGFAPVSESLEAAVSQQSKLKRYEVAGRKVIFYIENMLPGEQIALSFRARALYPVRAQAVTSQVYSYYRPEWKGESLGGAIVVGGL